MGVRQVEGQAHPSALLEGSSVPHQESQVSLVFPEAQ